MNGWGLPDWLVSPLGAVAVQALEFMQKADVPPRLAPLAGGRPRKIGDAEYRAIMGGFGHHERFTELVLDGFARLHAECAERIRGVPVEDLIDELDEGGDEPDHVVSLLVAEGRLEDARALAGWADDEADEASGVIDIVSDLARSKKEAEESVRQLRRQMNTQRRARTRAEQRIKKADEAARAAVTQAAEAGLRAKEAQDRLEENSARAQALQRSTAALQAEIDIRRRERRDLVAELQNLQARFIRLRRELRDLRAKVPPVKERPRPIRLPDPPPSLAELGGRLNKSGPKGVFDAKRIFVMVDGWNVGLGYIAKEKLEDKRRVLDQALERYHLRTGNKVMIVYDGREVQWFWARTAGKPTIMRVFTPEGETADDYIVAELESRSQGLTPVVATSDRELRERCRALGAFVVPSVGLVDALGI